MIEESQVSQMVGQKVLVTTDAWFTAPDGCSYKAVCGKLVCVESDKEVLGLKTNAHSTNWYIQVGRMLVAGCQIHYVINCEGVDVNFNRSKSEVTHEGVNKPITQDSRIYNADF